jgi:hypothetical protein
LSDAKKTGSRDISELKQRLGLKKGAAAASQTGATPRANGGASGGVVPPPGLNLPPPPGLAPQQPPQPVIPNAADDPFGAMNAMAAVGAVQRAPEIVIVNDGKPVENVGASGGSAKLLRIAVPAGVALIIGIAVGKIGTSNSSYNDGLKGAKAILGDKGTPSTVANLKKQLSDLDTFLDEAKTKKNFKPDSNIDKQLEAIAAKLEVKTELVFRAKENALDAETAGQIMGFYAGVEELKSMVDQHVKSAKSDDLAFANAAKKADAATIKDDEDAALSGQLRYGILIQAPTDTDKVDFGAKLVELGPPYCGDKLSTSGRCGEGEAPSAFAYRSEPGATWTKGDIVANGADSVPTKKLVMLLPGGVRDSLVKGAEGVASETLYSKRLRAIYEYVHGKTGPDGKPVGGLLETGNKLEQRLEQVANKGTRFSFFM